MNLTAFYYTNMNKESKCTINGSSEIEIGGKFKQHHTNNYDSQNGSNPIQRRANHSNNNQI